MSDRDLTMPLMMVTTPAEPLARQPARRAGRLKVSRYWIKHFIQQMAVLVFMGMLSYAVYYFVSQYWYRTVKVVGTSMVPTLSPGSEYILDCHAFNEHPPQRGEIVVIRDPGDHGLAIKRIIAVGGESVHFKDGSVYVNGQKLAEPYLPPHTLTFTYSQAHEQFITCGRDQYFVLGDNRLRSIDSRAYGPVSRNDILGLVKMD